MVKTSELMQKNICNTNTKPFGGERGRERGGKRERGREGEPGSLPGPNLLCF
jgi:hypothetical protein